MVVFVRREYLLTLALAAAVLGGMGVVLWHGEKLDVKQASGNVALWDSCVYIIDAGHGGEDGGAVAADGTTESRLNLEIADRTADLMRFCGATVRMTRSTDAAIYTEGAKTLREKKVSDLKNRAALVNRVNDSVLVSIHQNALPQSPQVHGAQAFFNGYNSADELADRIQVQLNQTINVDGDKNSKRISDTIYLMKHVTAPAVLVECGFLSNREEAAKLQLSEHQQKLALAITAGLLEKR